MNALPATGPTLDPAARWPAWMLPIVLGARLHHGLLASSAGDALALNRHLATPIRLAVPMAVVGLAGAFVALHALAGAQYAVGEVEWLRLQMDHAFTDVPLVVMLACVVGAFSPAAGALLVVTFGCADLVVSAGRYGELTPMPWALAGRLVGLWAMWLLVVEVPVAGRSLAVSVGRGSVNRFLQAALAALITAALTWAWTQVAPVLLRPLYLWATLGGVGLSSILPLQTAGLVFAVVAGAAAGVRALVAGPNEVLDRRAVLALPAAPPIGRSVGVALRLLAAGLLTVGLAGLVSSPIDALILFAAFAGAGPLARLVARRTPIGRVVRALPPLLRAVVATALALGTAILLVDRLIPVPGPTEFFAVVVALALGLLLVRLATAPSDEPGMATRAPGPGLLGGVLGLALLGIAVLVPGGVEADNCASFGDCWAAPLLAALAAGLLPVVMGLKDFDRWLEGTLRDWEREREEESSKENPWMYRGLERAPWFVRPMAANVPGIRSERE